MIEMSLGEAIDEYGSDLVIAATGAIAKKGKAPDDEVRVIYDGTHGVALNYGIKIRDQVRFPTAPDVKVVLSEIAEEPGPNFALDFDVSKAHRRCQVLRAEWGRQACQVKGSAAATFQEKRTLRNGRKVIKSRTSPRPSWTRRCT